MAFVGQILKPVQDLARAMFAGKTRKELPTADEWENWYQVSRFGCVLAFVSFIVF